MQVRPGFLAIPWVKTIDHNDEHYFKEIVSRIPTATIAWRNLLYLYIDQNRLDEARDAALEYLRLYPQGYTQALHVGIALKQMSRYRDAAPFFEYVVDHHPTYDAYQQLGWTLQQMGEIDRAATVFETSLPLNRISGKRIFIWAKSMLGKRGMRSRWSCIRKCSNFILTFPRWNQP
ncbi:MAG: hypothetical protein U0361_14770 [Nitrospiraceae bacterium]